MKTLFHNISDDIEHIFFFELEGDYSHLDQTIINSSNDTKKWAELNSILYGENMEDNTEWEYKITRLDKPTKDWDFFVTVGFLM